MMKNVSKLIVAALLVCGLVACESDDPEDAQPDEQTEAVQQQADEQPDEQPEQAAEEESELVQEARELGARAESFSEDPESLDAWLEERDMTEDQLEDLLFDISRDEAASRAYAEER